MGKRSMSGIGLHDSCINIFNHIKTKSSVSSQPHITYAQFLKLKMLPAISPLLELLHTVNKNGIYVFVLFSISICKCSPAPSHLPLHLCLTYSRI